LRSAIECLRRGELVPDSTVWEMVRERSQCLRCRSGFILDGFPRTLVQADALKRHMENEGLTLNAVINYEVPLRKIVDV
jgi:adenylate kinase